MSHTFSSDRCFCNFYTASVADNTFITDFFIFTTMALPVLTWPENSFTEKSVLLRFQSTVVDGFRFRYLTSGPLSDLLRGRQSDLDGIESHWLICFIGVGCFCHVFFPLSYSSSSKDSSNSIISSSSSMSSSSSTLTSSSPLNSCLV